MRVEVDHTVNRLTLGPVPDEIIDEMKRAFEGGGAPFGDLDLRLEIRNSLAMSTAVYIDENSREAKIVLDWAQIERIPIVARQIVWDENIEEQQGRFFAAAARELRVYWKRRLITSGPGEIAVEDRVYDGRRENDPIPTAEFNDAEHALAARYGLFLITHELCHLVARESGDFVQQAYMRFEEHYPRLISAPPGLAEELYCDQQALVSLADMRIHATPVELNNEIALAMAVGRLQSEVRVAAPRIRSGFASMGHATQGGKRRLNKETRLGAEWIYRMFQVDIMLEEILKEAGYGDATRAAAKATRSAFYRWPTEVLQEDYMGWIN